MRVIHIASDKHLYNRALNDALRKYHNVEVINIEHILRDFNRFINLLYHRNELGINIIHFHHFGLTRFSSIRTIKLLIRFLDMMKIKTVWTMHDVVYQENPYYNLELFKYFYQNIHIKIVHSPEALQMINKYYSIKPDINTYIIPHISFNDILPDNLDEQISRNILGIGSDEIVISFVGAIRVGKGIFEFLELTKRLHTFSNLKFIVAGKIVDKINYDRIYNSILETKEELKNKIIINLDYIPDVDMQIYFKSSDVIVIPHREGYTTSGIISLSYAFKKPVITTRVGSNYFYVDNECGLLVEPNNIEQLTEACLYLYNNIPIAREMGKRGYIKMDLIAHPKSIAESHYKIYSSKK